MRRILLLAAVISTMSLLSCSPSSEPATPDQSPYLEDYSVIENLIEDLQTAWIRREIDPYSDLFAEDFVFVFQEDDADGIPEGFWNKDDEVLGVSRIFDSSQVTAIRSDLTYGNPEPNQLTVVTEELATRIVVFDTFIDVDLDGGETTLRVDGDVQWFFCRMGDASKDEDPSRWYIIEWQDLGSTTLAAVQPLSVEANTWGKIKRSLGNASRPAVENTTWGAIKNSLNKPRSSVTNATRSGIKKRL